MTEILESGEMIIEMDNLFDEFLKNIHVAYVSSNVNSQERAKNDLRRLTPPMGWENIMYEKDFPDDFIERLIQSKSVTHTKNDLRRSHMIKKISETQGISEELLTKYIDRLNWSVILANQEVSEDIINSVIEMYKGRDLVFSLDSVIWTILNRRQDISEEFLQKHINLFSSFGVEKYYTLSEDFMRTNPDMIDWEYVERNYDLSDDFINDFGGRMDFVLLLTRFFNLSERTLENYISDIDKSRLWHGLFRTQQVSESFIRKYSDRFESLWHTIVETQNISDDLIIEHIRFMDLDYLYERNQNREWSDSMILIFENAGINVNETK